jgi:hypothetical protein
MVAWLIIAEFGLDGWHLLVQSLIITINYNNSQKIWLPRTRSILVSLYSDPNCYFWLTTYFILVRDRVTFPLAVYRRSVRLGDKPPWNSRPVILFSNWTLVVIIVFMHHPLYNCCWFSPKQSFSGQSPMGLTTTFYWLSLLTDFILIWTASYTRIAYRFPKKCLLITRILGSVFRNKLVSKNESLRKRVCQLVS